MMSRSNMTMLIIIILPILLSLQRIVAVVALVPSIPTTVRTILNNPSFINTIPSTRSVFTTSSTSLGYKYHEYDDDDDTYPIPVGTTLRIMSDKIGGAAISTSTELSAKAKQVLRSTISTTNRPQQSASYDESMIQQECDDNYPIPVGGGTAVVVSSEQTSASSSSAPVLGDDTAVAVEPPIHTTTSLADGPLPTTVKSLIEKQERKAIITKITSVQEFFDYLSDDERITVVQFLAPWCKSCRKLKQRMNQVAIEYGDVVMNRVKVKGLIRIAFVEFTPKLESFITGTLRIRGVPTVQVFGHTTNKVWSSTGLTSTNELMEQINSLLQLKDTDRINHSVQQDDGIVQNAIENCFYDDHPDFLDEEW